MISFFTDISAEMAYPLIPLYLASVYGATPTMVGVIEGIAESLASLLKVYGGYISDRFQRKKALAFAGYSAGLAYKIILLLANSWAWVLFARMVDRFGKGVRTAPRDVMVSESAAAGVMGRAFGLHKALDMAGSSVGILITYFLLRLGPEINYQHTFSVSMIPAVAGLMMFFFVREKKAGRARGGGATPIRLIDGLRGLDGRLKLYLFVVFLFTLGNSSNAFLLLRAKSVGFGDADVILLYFVYSVSAAALSLPMSALSDRLGRKALLVSGYAVFSAAYFGFAFARAQATLAAMFVLYGAHTAMISGAERAYVAEIAPSELKGTMLGLQSTVSGAALLPASVVTGALWSAFGPVTPFAFGAALALTAALIVYSKDLGAPPQTPQGDSTPWPQLKLFFYFLAARENKKMCFEKGCRGLAPCRVWAEPKVLSGDGRRNRGDCLEFGKPRGLPPEIFHGLSEVNKIPSRVSRQAKSTYPANLLNKITNFSA
jgi:MFS family permease